MNAKSQSQTIVGALEEHFRRYLAIDPRLPLVLALWALATYLFQCFDACSYLAITSPTKRCGKTRVAELLELVCAKSRRTVGITPAALFRVIEKEEPTLIIDEAEALRGKDDRTNALREILNAGHRKGQKVLRCVGGNGKDYKTREFETYCPKVIVLIGSLPETLADRSISITMRRRLAGEQVQRFILRQAQADAAGIRKLCQKWTEKNRGRVQRHYETKTDVPSLHDREAELWAPLFAVCAVAAPERVADLETVARELAGVKATDEPGDMGIRLLDDLRHIFAATQEGRLATEKLLPDLNAMHESPWPTWSYGRGLNARGLSTLLRPFDIHPQNLRTGERVVKGYLKEDFEDSWARYLPPASSRYTATRLINTGENDDPASATPSATASATESVPSERSATVADCSVSQIQEIVNAGAGCSGVADSAGGMELPSLAEFAAEPEGRHPQ